MYRTLESIIRQIMMESTTSAMRAGSLESDQEDQVAVGSYVTKAFEMDPAAQILYSNLPKDTDANAAEQAAIHLDRLFRINKHVLNTGYASAADVGAAEQHVKVIMQAAINMPQQADELARIADAHLNSINNKYQEHPRFINPEDHLNPVDDPRFGTSPTNNTPDAALGPQGDRDSDNVKTYLIKRMKAAQRKIKIIDAD